MINMEVGEREKELAQTRTKENGEVRDPPFFLLIIVYPLVYLDNVKIIDYHRAIQNRIEF